MAEIVSFSRTPEQFSKYGERSIINQINAGLMTEEDANLIRAFVDDMRVQNGCGDARAYKLLNGLVNVTRFIKTPLMSCTMADINAAVLNIKAGKKISSSISGCKPKVIEEGAEVRELIINDKKYYQVRRTAGDLSDDTKHDYIMFLKRLFLWAIDEGYCNLPSEKIRKIKAPSPKKSGKTVEQMLSEEEILQMIESCRGVTGIRDRALISVLYEGGLRINEVAGLKWSDLKFEGAFVKMNVESKTGIPRYIPLNISKEYISAWRAEYPDGSAEGDKPVFLTSRAKMVIENGEEVRKKVHKTLSYYYCRNLLQRIAARAQIKKHISCHLFRHSRVTALLQQGFQESVIKMMLWGSLSSDMLSHYAHLSNHDIDSAMAAHAGIELEENKQEDKFKNRICPRCHTINEPTAGYCKNCGQVLSAEAAIELEEAKKEVHADPRYAAALEKLQAQINSLSALISNQ